MQARKIWMGRWTIGVALCHTVVGLLVGGKVLGDLAERGVVNAMGTDPMTGYIVWFLLLGPVLALLGMAIGVIERSGQTAQARPIGVGLLLLTVLGVTLMPASGFWLMIPVVVGLLRAPAAAPELRPSGAA